MKNIVTNTLSQPPCIWAKIRQIKQYYSRQRCSCALKWLCVNYQNGLLWKPQSSPSLATWKSPPAPVGLGSFFAHAMEKSWTTSTAPKGSEQLRRLRIRCFLLGMRFSGWYWYFSKSDKTYAAFLCGACKRLWTRMAYESLFCTCVRTVWISLLWGHTVWSCQSMCALPRSLEWMSIDTRGRLCIFVCVCVQEDMGQ